MWEAVELEVDNADVGCESDGLVAESVVAFGVILEMECREKCREGSSNLIDSGQTS